MDKTTKLLYVLLILAIIALAFFAIFFHRTKKLVTRMDTEIDMKNKHIKYLERQVDILSNYKKG